MKKLLLFLSLGVLSFLADAQAAPLVTQSWSLYSGTKFVKSYPTLLQCTAGANQLAPGAYVCAGATSTATILNPGLKTTITNSVTSALNSVTVSEWQPLVTENSTFTLPVPKTIRYGKEPTWITKDLPAGPGVCNNATFTDPLVGQFKSCEIHFGSTVISANPAAPIPPTAAPPAPPVATPPAGTASQPVASVPLPAAPPASAPPPLVPIVPPTPVWSLAVTENTPFILSAPTTIRYGANGTFVQKDFAAGTINCSNVFFGDPLPGIVKHCEVSNIAPTTPVMPAMVDHSQMNVKIDPILLAAVQPNPGNSGARVRTIWHYKDNWGKECPQQDETLCFVFDAEKPTPSDIGDFREPTDFVKFANVDPIVFANDASKESHPHTFMGNVDINALTTPESILKCSASTNAGGQLNCSSYWFPTAVDTRVGQPLKPNSGLVYYKCSYEFDICTVGKTDQLVELMPTGLRVITGDAKNTDPNNAAGRFTCYGPDGQSGPTGKTIPEAMVGDHCKKGGTLHFGIGFPYCWDGVNLDSPDHHSHVSWAEQYRVQRPVDQGGDYYPRRCPATHPKVLPTISYSFSYNLTDDDMIGYIRYVSDTPGTPAGTSFHADYYFGWDRETGNKWINNCLRKNIDCHAWGIGGGETLY